MSLERVLGGPVGRAGIVALVLGAWEAGARAGWLSSFVFSSPSEIAGVLGRWLTEGRVLGNLLLTLGEAGAGFVLGAILGMALGFLFAFVPSLAEVLEPFMVMLNSFPRLTLAPLFIVWFGFGMLPKIVLVTAFILFICFFNTYKGLREVEPELLDRVRLWGASGWQMTSAVYLPTAAAWIVTGLRASVGFALIGAVVGEYVGGDAGIGFLILQGQSRLRIREVFAGLALLLAVATVVDFLMRRLESRLLRWRPAPSAAAGATG